MGSLSEFLFGRRAEFHDARMGILRARIKRNRPGTAVVWTGEHRFPGQPKETGILLEGDAHGPHRAQVESVHRLLDGLDDILRRMAREAAGAGNSGAHDPRDPPPAYFLSSIFPDSAFGRLDVTLEPVDEEHGGHVHFVWDGKEVTDLTFDRSG